MVSKLPSIVSAQMIPIFLIWIDLSVVITPDGSEPTITNSSSLSSQNTPKGGRGSMVWFSQASMIQTAEMPFTTVKEVKEKEREAQRKHKRPEPYYLATFDIASNFNTYFPPPPGNHST